jgi:HSP20 family molecular chaperone IbpA
LTNPPAVYKARAKTQKEEKEGVAMPDKSVAVQGAKEPIDVKPVTFENLFERANTTFNAITKRAYDIFEKNGHSFGHELDHWFQAERELLHPLHLDVTESKEALDIKAEVPGFNEEDLQIDVEPRRLVISGKREAKKEEKKDKTVYSETCSDQIMRVIDLPADVETQKVSATLKNGILELHLPKTSKARSVRVEPEAAA